MAEVGRPSEYKEEYCQKVDEYLSLCEDVITEQNRQKVNLPTIEGFAQFIDVSKKSLYNWSEQNEAFLHALSKIELEQKKRLINKGLSNDYNPTIAKLILSANHDMREKQDLTGNLFKKGDLDEYKQ